MNQTPGENRLLAEGYGCLCRSTGNAASTETRDQWGCLLAAPSPRASTRCLATDYDACHVMSCHL